MRGRAEEFAPNWVRWGDAQSLKVKPGNVASQKSDQLVKVDHDRPLTWGVMMVADFGSGWVSPFTANVVFHVELGVGSARTELLYTVAVATPFAQVRINDPHPVIIPASNLNIWAELTNLVAEFSSPLVTRFSAYAAPQFHEPWLRRAEPGEPVRGVRRTNLPGAHE